MIIPGQILDIRSRLWRVDDYQDDIITATSIGGTQTRTRRFFEPVEIIEDGKLLPPSSEYIGSKQNQELLLMAHRLSMIHGAAPLMSLQRSRAVPEAFQMVPVVMSLNMPRVRMLIADDVGLGKTIEAGLIITELLARQKASRVLVICPAALREQWKQALSYFFHLDTEIISSRHRRTLERNLSPGASPWAHYPYLITSMDYAKRAEVRTQILEQDWDVVVVDEVHNLAKPHQVSASHKVDMERWDLLRRIAKLKSKHLILLTATPHNGFSDTFASLLNVLDVKIVSGPPHKPTIDREKAIKYVCQRRRKDVENSFTRADGKSPFPTRDTREEYITPSAFERDIYSSLEDFGNHLLKVSGSESHIKQILAKWTITHFHKRALSSPRALRCSLQNRRRRLLRAEDVRSVTIEEAKAEVLDNDSGERVDDEEAGHRMERLIWGDSTANEREIELIDELARKAKALTPRRDQKLTKLLTRTVNALIRRDPKVIIFTRYKDTLDYLQREIPRHKNYQNVKVVSLDGSLNASQRRERMAEFSNSRRAVLVATDCISEGMNLQHYAAQLIHYELPWNPNRLEQRNGRVDRYGQKRMDEVAIRTMVMEDSLEAHILKVLVEKANRIRHDHGFSPPFFGDDVSVLDLIQDQGIDISIGQTKLDSFLDGMSEERIESEIKPYSDESIAQIKDDCFYGHTDIEIQDVHERMRKTEQLIGSSEELKQFVLYGLRLLRSEVEERPDGSYYITIPDPRLKRGLNRTKNLLATFDPELGLDKLDMDVIVLGHPLVRNLIETVKDISYSSEDFYGRNACIKTSAVPRLTYLYHYLVRYSVKTTPPSIIEELVPIGFSGDTLLNPDQIDEIIKAKPLPDQRTENELKSDVDMALERSGLDQAVEQQCERNRQELIAERKHARELLEAQGVEEAIAGIDEITLASKDLLSVTIYYPAPGVSA